MHIYSVSGLVLSTTLVPIIMLAKSGHLTSIFEDLSLSGHYISTNLAEKLLNLLSRQLLTAVQVSLDTFSLITGGTDGDLRTEEDIMLSLHNLDCCVRSVRRGLQSVVRYYFPIFSLILISSAIAITVETYVLIRGFHFNGATVVLLMLSVALIAQLCFIAGNFLSEVDKAVDILMEVKCKTVNAALKARLAHICLTNLIVLLQMAGLY
ncbi:hypothetical protein Pcinc_036516 [Petrolisthes cinctipes]|uniref:Uncharacterized protein n=1 Tax=Petrolisthes cinctipes TaxID=88211 RepID=A0AAE1BUM8_PETCI|nr:hypothetical protein Pcinc_036516 [Petrolisthes cinctipes]